MAVNIGVWEIPSGVQKGLKKPFLELSKEGQFRTKKIFMGEAILLLDHMSYLKAELEKFVNSAKKFEHKQKPIVEIKNIVENKYRRQVIADVMPKETVAQLTTTPVIKFTF